MPTAGDPAKADRGTLLLAPGSPFLVVRHKPFSLIAGGGRGALFRRAGSVPRASMLACPEEDADGLYGRIARSDVKAAHSDHPEPDYEWLNLLRRSDAEESDRLLGVPGDHS